MGFGADVVGVMKKDQGEILKMIEPEDLLKFGLIPEFVGRLPVVVTLENLDTEALKVILTQPKNALVKQYSQLFRYDGVEFEVEDEALEAIAKKAADRKTGARGLRAIMEESLTDIMFEIPSEENIEKVVLTKDCIENNSAPEIVYGAEKRKLVKASSDENKEESVS